ncbi:MAG: hydroxyacylglutathione hydrolase family protein [Thermoplasmatota archaeon]
MTVEQIRVGSDNFSYLIHSGKGTKAALVDPGFDTSGILRSIEDLTVILKVIIATHHHSDHTAGIHEIKKETGALIVASEEDGSRIAGGVDVTVKDGEVLNLGGNRIEILKTPGHTPGGICLIVDNEFLITGDTMFINDCGRCDLPGGSLEDMYDSLQRIKDLPDDLMVLPGHDYGPKPRDRLGNQKTANFTMNVNSLEEFSKL